MKGARLGLGLFWAALRVGAMDYHVAPDGSDLNPGTAARPWATLGGARDGVRARRGLSAGAVTVWLKGGYYNLATTAVFEPVDSGTPGAPIVYASAPGESAHLTGAVNLDPGWFTRVDRRSPIWDRLDPAAQGHVYAVRLFDHGITDLGALEPRGFNLRAVAPLELSYDGRPMTLARWPNVDDPLSVTGTVLSDRTFTYTGSRPARWSRASDIWMHGLWSQNWADFHVAVARIDPVGRTITLAGPPAQYGIASRQPYYAYNLLEELDVPGEYYVDRTSGVLYFWPPGPLAGSVLQASMLKTSILAVNGARFITFRGLTVESARGPLVTIGAGDHIQFDGCVLRNAGQFAAQIAGTHNGITGSEIAFCGDEGVRLAGGDRAALTPGDNYVSESRIHGTGRIAWTYKPGVVFEGGCGNRATHDLLEDLPHAAVLFSGNNHLIAYNEIRDVCQLTSDAGAIYAGQSWSFRGNVIEYNYLHEIASHLGSPDVNGIYLDDCMSGVVVFANIFYRISGTAIFCGGGRDNLMCNNIIACCGTAHCDDDRGRSRITAVRGSAWNLLAGLGFDRIAYQQAPWSKTFPACAAIPDSWAGIEQGLWRNPQNSVFAHNVGWGNRRWLHESDSSGTGVFRVYAKIEDNHSDSPPLFEGDGPPRTARLEVPGGKFVGIPFAAIGPSTLAPLRK